MTGDFRIARALHRASSGVVLLLVTGGLSLIFGVDADRRSRPRLAADPLVREIDLGG